MMQPIPEAEQGTIDEWHQEAMEGFARCEAQISLLVCRYAAIVDGACAEAQCAF